jgi:hypothetical protein
MHRNMFLIAFEWAEKIMTQFGHSEDLEKEGWIQGNRVVRLWLDHQCQGGGICFAPQSWEGAITPPEEGGLSIGLSSRKFTLSSEHRQEAKRAAWDIPVVKVRVAKAHLGVWGGG